MTGRSRMAAMIFSSPAPHDHVRRAVAPRCLGLQFHLPGCVEPNPLVGQRRPGDVAAQLFQPLAVMGFDPHRGVQAEAIDVGTQGRARCGLARCRAPQGQHLLPGARAEGNLVADGRRLQRPQGARLLAVGISRSSSKPCGTGSRPARGLSHASVESRAPRAFTLVLDGVAGARP